MLCHCCSAGIMICFISMLAELRAGSRHQGAPTCVTRDQQQQQMQSMSLGNSPPLIPVVVTGIGHLVSHQAPQEMVTFKEIFPPTQHQT